MMNIWKYLNQVEDARVVTKLTTGVTYVPAVASWPKSNPLASIGFLRNTIIVT